MKKRYLLVSGFIVFVILLSPFQTQAQTYSNEEVYRETLIQLIELLQKQIISLQAELERRVEAEREERREFEVIVLKDSGKFTDSVQITAFYEIDSMADVNEIRNQGHRKYFARVFELFPTEYDKILSRLLVFEGEDAEFDAYVETVPPNHDHWQFSVNEEIVEEENSTSNTELIVHELAHIISYEEVVGMPVTTEINCEDYFDIHGCPAENSYLRQFVNDFWSSSDIERAERFSQKPEPFEAAYNYYEFHEDDFVSDYAASSPEEDFSESFMFYVLDEPVEDDTLAQEKVDWFKQYSKLVTVRREILSNQ